MQTEKIRSIADLVGVVDALIRDTERIWWFRGQAKPEWHLSPSIMRGYSREQEKFFSNEFFVRANLRYANCPPIEDFAGWLALMQHYRVPTRLLDWSYSPLVAAFFATAFLQSSAQKEPDTDACIWAIQPSELNASQELERLLYPLSARTLQDMITPSRIGKDKTSRVAAAMAVETDLRMLMQQGAFTVHSSETPLDLMDGCDDWLCKYIIPRDSVRRVAWEVKLLGCRLGDVFPDLDGLAGELTSRHQPVNG